MRISSIFIVVAGLLLLVWPSAIHQMEEQQQKQLIQDWQNGRLDTAMQTGSDETPLPAESVMAELSELFQGGDADGEPINQPTVAVSAASAPESMAKPATIRVPAAAAAQEAAKPPVTQVTPAKPAMLGIIEIPDIELKLPILEGVSASNLSIAAGHIPGTGAPGQIGNAVIAAHRSYSYGRLFNRLEQLNAGNEVIVHTSDQTYTYTIYEIKTVDPTDVTVLNRNQTDRILTLLTCTEDGSQRLVVHAKLKAAAGTP